MRTASPCPKCVRSRRWIIRQARFARGNRGLTLIELLLYANFTDQARTARAVADIAVVASEISTFESTNERLPNDLAEIGRATLRDPWGRPYEYLNVSLSPGLARKDLALHPINSDFDL